MKTIITIADKSEKKASKVVSFDYVKKYEGIYRPQFALSGKPSDIYLITTSQMDEQDELRTLYVDYTLNYSQNFQIAGECWEGFKFEVVENKEIVVTLKFSV